MLLGILTAILISYIGPVRGYLAQRAELTDESRSLELLRERRDALRGQLQALGRPEVIETRARELGLALPGERTYVVRGLPTPAAEPAARSVGRSEGDGDDGLFGWLPDPF